MTANRRLEASIRNSGHSIDDLAVHVEVDPKTVERWIMNGRVPHRRHRESVARFLGVPAAYIWPTAPGGMDGAVGLEGVYQTRRELAPGAVAAMISGARDRIDILAYAATWLWDSVPDVTTKLALKAASGVAVHVCLGDPESDAVRLRGIEEGIGTGMSARCRIAIATATSIAGVETRLTATTLYGSVYRFDNDLLWNPHSFGTPAADGPVLWLRSQGEQGMAATVLRSQDRVWESAQLLRG